MPIKTFQFIVIFILCLNSLSCSNEESVTGNFLEKGIVLFEQGKFDKAKLEIKNAIKDNLNRAEAYYYMALLDEKEKKYKAMRSNLIESVKLGPASIKTRLKLGKIYSLFNELDKSQEEIENILLLAPENTDAFALQASVLIKQQNHQAAQLLIDKVLQKDPAHIDAISLKAILLLKSKSYDDALAVVSPALLKQENNIPLLLLKIQIDTKLNNIEALIISYEKLAELKSDNIQIKYSLAKIYLNANKKQKAENILRSLVQEHPKLLYTKLALLNFLYKDDSNQALKQLDSFIEKNKGDYPAKISFSKWLLSKNNSGKAIEILNQLTVDEDAKKKDKETASLLLAKLEFSKRNFDHALVKIEKLLARNSANLEAKLLKSQVLVARENYNDAINILDKILLDKPKMDKALSTLAYVNQVQGDLDKAFANFSAALKINPKNLNALFFLVDKEASEGHVNYAIELLEKTLNYLPNSSQILTRLIQLNINEKKWDSASKYIERFQLQKNGAIFSHYLKGKVLQEQYKIEEAISFYKEALLKYPWQKNSLIALSECYLELNQQTRMVEYLDQFTSKHPNIVFPYVLKSQLLSRRQEYSKAVNLLNNALQNEKLMPLSLYKELARVYSLTGNKEAEYTAYIEGLKGDPNDINLLLLLAAHLEKLKEYNQAVEQYEKILRIDSKQNVAKNNLAALFLDHYSDEGKLNKALQLTKTFKQSKQPYFLDTYGWAQFKNGNLQNSLSILKKVIILEPDVAVFRYHLAMAYYNLSDTMSASSELKQAMYIGKGKEFPEKGLIEGLLEKIK